jgi:hypothetical protein
MTERKKKPGKFKEQQARHKGYAMIYEAKKALRTTDSVDLEIFGVNYSLAPAPTDYYSYGEYCLVKFNKGIILCYIGPTYRGLDSIPSWNGFYITNKQQTRIPRHVVNPNNILARVTNVIFTRPMEDCQFRRDMIENYGQSVLGPNQILSP